MDKLNTLVTAYKIIEREFFAHQDGLYQGRRDKALFLLTKLIIDDLIENPEGGNK